MSTENNTSSLKPSDQLKIAREKMGASLNDVALSTKINVRLLKAIEAGDFSELPPQSFSRGFIRSFATYLKIDPKPILEQYQADEDKKNNVTPLAAETATTATRNQEAVSSLAESSLSSKIFLVAGLFVIVGLIFGVKKLIDKYEQEKVVAPVEATATETSDSAKDPSQAATKTSETKIIATENNTEENKLTDNKQTSPNTATVLPNNTKISDAKLTNPAQNTSKNQIVAPGLDIKTDLALPTDKKTTEQKTEKTSEKSSENKSLNTPPVFMKPIVATQTPPASVTPPKTPTPTKAPMPTPAKAIEPTAAEVKPAVPVITKDTLTNATAAANKPSNPQEVIIEALDAVDITIQIDGGESRTISLKPETVQTLKGKYSIELNIKDGGMVNVIHNGQDRGVPGDLGKSAHLKYP
ncbi:MAG: helix-turn-helix domain-containing protein [Bdellovibrionales bacterium]